MIKEGRRAMTGLTSIDGFDAAVAGGEPALLAMTDVGPYA